MEKLNNINFNSYIKKDNNIDDELDYTNIEYTEYSNESKIANCSKSNVDISINDNDITIGKLKDEIKKPEDNDLKLDDYIEEKHNNLTREIKVSDKLDMNLYFQNNEDKYFILSLLNNLNDISNTYSTIAKSMEYFIHSLEQSKDRIVSSDSIVSKNFVVDLLKNLINIIYVELDSNQFFRKSTNFYINSKLMYTTPIINFEINDNFFKFEFIQNNKLEFYIDLNETDKCYLIDNSIDTITSIYEHTNNLFNKLSIIMNYLNIKKCN